MARILYALSGEGFGHATRSEVLIRRLSQIKKGSKTHEIKIVCGGKAYFYLSKHFNDVEKIQPLHIKYCNNKVSGIGTFLKNISTLPNQLISYIKIKKIIKEFKPEIIINDFEHLSAYAALFNNIPLISIGNHHVISNATHNIPARSFWEYFKSLIVITFVIPHVDYYYITSFFKPNIKRKFAKNSEYIPIIVRDEIRKMKIPIAQRGRVSFSWDFQCCKYPQTLFSTKSPQAVGYLQQIKPNYTYNDYSLVYQTSATNNNLLCILKDIPKKFIVYGFNIDKTEGNILFKSFREKEFYKDMADCSAVIINGGFSLMSEAIYLKKPVYSEPVKHQFEQILNAIYLQKLGYGMFVETSGKESLLTFFSKLDEYKKNLNKLNTKRMDSDFDKAIVNINEKIVELIKSE